MKKQAMLALLIAVSSSNHSFATEPVTPPDTGHHKDGAFHHRFQNAEQWAKKFDEPARDEWQKPEQVIAAMTLSDTMTVADIGAGTGYFSTRLAKVVTKGRVYAADIEPDMVKYLSERAKKENLANIIAVQTSADSANLPEAVDKILLVDTYHHISNRETYFKKLANSLKQGGQLIIVDFKLDESITDAPPKMHRISIEKLTQELTVAGYQFLESQDLPRQYIAVFSKISN